MNSYIIAGIIVIICIITIIFGLRVLKDTKKMQDENEKERRSGKL